MFWKKFIAIITSFLLVLVSACNLIAAPVVVTATNQRPNIPIETQVAAAVASTAAAQRALANSVAATLTAMAPNNPASPLHVTSCFSTIRYSLTDVHPPL